jgi:NADP-dependent 3-hydroxy acid dehydrogenase YdfG
MDTIQEGIFEDWDAMLDITVKDSYISRAILPKMISKKKDISSI